MKILITEVTLSSARIGWRATLTTSKNREFSWCVVNFADIERQAQAYEDSEKEAA